MLRLGAGECLSTGRRAGSFSVELAVDVKEAAKVSRRFHDERFGIQGPVLFRVLCSLHCSWATVLGADAIDATIEDRLGGRLFANRVSPCGVPTHLGSWWLDIESVSEVVIAGNGWVIRLC